MRAVDISGLHAEPKGLAKIAEFEGRVSIDDTDKSRTVVITDEAGEEHRETFPRRTRLLVSPEFRSCEHVRVSS